jgi:hypothetical protein
MFDVLANQTTIDIRYDKEAHAFKPVADVAEGPVFSVRQLSFWQNQERLSLVAAVDQVRKLFELGLVSIDGDTDKALAFIANPHARLGAPLNDYIAAITWGN